MIDLKGIIDIQDNSEDAGKHDLLIILSTIIDNINGGVTATIINDDQTHFLLTNNQYFEQLGYTKEQFENEVSSAFDLIYPSDRNRVLTLTNEASKNRHPFSITYRVICRDGSIRWMKSNISIINLPGFSDPVQLSVANDITVEKLALAQISLYQSLVNDSNTAVIIAEKTNRTILYVNNAWRRLENVTDTLDVCGLCLYDVLPKDKVFFSDEEIESLSMDYYLEFHKTNSTGKAIVVNARALIWDGIDSYVCYISDESAVWNSRQQLKHLIDFVPAGLGIYELKAGVLSLIYINEAYYHMLGFERSNRKKYFGSNTINAIYENDLPLVRNAIQQLELGSDRVDILLRVYNSLNELFWVRFIGVVVGRENNIITIYSSFSDFNSVMNAKQESESNRAMLSAALRNAKTIAWKYDCRNHIITDSGTLGETYNLQKQIDNIPESLIELGLFEADRIDELHGIYDNVSEEKQLIKDIKIKTQFSDSVTWKRWVFTPNLDEHGRYSETIVISIDITEQRNREHKYNDQLKMKRGLAKNEKAVALFNLTQNTISDIDSADAGIINFLKYNSVDDFFLAVSSSISDAADREAYINVFDRQTMLDNFSRDLMHSSIRHYSSGTSRWFESSYDLIENPYTHDIEALAILRDVSDFVQAEQVVDTLMKLDYESITVIDADTGAAAPFMKGQLKEVISEQERLGDCEAGVEYIIRKYCTDSDVERVVLETNLKYVKKRLEQVPIHSTTYSLTREGKTIHKRTVYTYINRYKKSILCAMQDLTETYLIKEQQKKALAEALSAVKKADKAKTDFFSRMSHDMRTPMNGILGLVELSIEENDMEVLRQNILKIKESGKYLLELINDTLDFQRIESGKMKLTPQIVRIGELLDNIFDVAKIASAEKQLDFQMNSKNIDLDSYIHIDPIRLKQILLNLISNAIKFTPEKGSINFEIECLQKDGNISHNCLRIMDTGIGMSKGFLTDEIFAPFSQEYNEVSMQYAGSGLGLSIVHKLVELMGGDISIESTQGVGSTFTVTLDFEHIENQTAAVSKASVEKTMAVNPTELAGKKILLVEDNHINAEIAKKLLKRVECEVFWAKNGEEGVNYYKNQAPFYFDAILMDIRMPVMNGFEATEMIRASNRPDSLAIPIIAMTANAYDTDVQQSLSSGMNEHLTKPINVAKMYETLAFLINNKSDV